MKKTISPTRPFAKQRDYDFISGIEKKFFSKLYTHRGNFSGKNLSVDQELSKATSFSQSKEDMPLNIVVCFDVTTGSKQFGVEKMYLGTQLKPHRVAREQQVTHFFALTMGNTCKVKLHIDLDFDVEADEPKPSPHIQIGGRSLEASKISFENSWDKHIDKPRLPGLPFCTPLLWHAAFMEFKDCESVKPFVNEGWWKNLVRDAENSLWEPFINDMSSCLGKKSIIESLYPVDL